VEKGLVDKEMMVVPNEQPPEIAQPGKGSFDFPTFAIAPQLAAVVERCFSTILAMRGDQDDAPLEQAPTQWMQS
jgi:hypothetical protein